MENNPVEDPVQATIKFIQAIKEANLMDNKTKEIPIVSRVDESIYYHDLDQSEMLFSLTN